MFALALVRSLFRTRPTPAPRTARLGLDTFEDRVVPASISFANGVLYVQADQSTDDTVTIVAAGKKRDGSTGVTVTFGGQTATYGAAGDPVTNIALDMKDGNDSVTVASLVATSVYVGEGNGTNVIKIGDTKSAGLIAGSGQNTVSIGGGTTNVFSDYSMPGYTAGVGVYLGWTYQFVNDGRDIFTGDQVRNDSANVINLLAGAGQNSLVDILGSGNNQITGTRGNSSILINGDGSNTISTSAGTDQVTINGNGNNNVTARGAGSITITGVGTNTVDAGRKAGMTVSLYGAGAGSSVTGANVSVDGTQVTSSGQDGNVAVKLT